MILRRFGVLIAVLFVFDVQTIEAQCSYSVAPTSVSASSVGQNGSIAVTTGGLCAWTAASDVPWITITGGASMTGLGSAAYSVAANGTGSSRTGTLTVAGHAITVTQSANSCTYSVAPTSVSVVPTGMNGSIAVTTGGLCSWTATSSVPWITITGGASMTGLGSASYSVASTTVPRTGTLTVAGHTVTVTQGSVQPPQPPPAPVNLRIVQISFN